MRLRSGGVAGGLLFSFLFSCSVAGKGIEVPGSAGNVVGRVALALTRRCVRPAQNSLTGKAPRRHREIKASHASTAVNAPQIEPELVASSSSDRRGSIAFNELEF